MPVNGSLASWERDEKPLTAAEMEASTFGAWDFVFYTPPDAAGRLRAWTYDGEGDTLRLPARDLRLATGAR